MVNLLTKKAQTHFGMSVPVSELLTPTMVYQHLTFTVGSNSESFVVCQPPLSSCLAYCRSTSSYGLISDTFTLPLSTIVPTNGAMFLAVGWELLRKL